MVVARLVDGALDRGVEEALDRRIEAIERHQRADLFVLRLLGRALEGVEGGAFALGEMQAGGAGLADGLEDLLDQT